MTTDTQGADPADRRSLDRAHLAQALETANIPTLLMVLVQLTGDMHWLQEPYLLTRTRGMEDNDTGGLPPELQTAVRAAALDTLDRWLDGQPPAVPVPSADLMARMLAVSMGDEVDAEYGPMLQEELAASVGEAPYAALDVPDGVRAAIIGAGLSGVAAAATFEQLGIPYVVIERSTAVGGVWRDNRYPGAGVDTPSHLYSYSFAPHDWRSYFAARGEVAEYIADVAQKFGVAAHIRYGTEVTRAVYDEAAQRWHLELAGADGPDGLDVDFVVSAVGAFVAPKLPNIPGIDTFEGPVVHTANWPSDLSVAGKRVAVIGNGASAMQVVPAIVDQVRELTVFQRQPQWSQPFEKLHRPIPDSERLLLVHVPLYRAWYRMRLTWIFHDKLYESLQRDPGWPHQDRSINAANDRHREYLTKYILAELGDRADLAAQLVPDYPPFGKRMLLDNGWYRALRRDNARLVSEPIVGVDGGGVATVGGTHYDVDVIVAATGFDVVRFLSTIDVIGVGGRRLRDEWDDDNCAAYLGLVVPGFPNLFTLYGPNTQPGHGGSLIGTVEDQIHYMASVLGQMFDRNIGSVSCKRTVYENYTRTIDEAHSRMVWTHPGMTTYYRNSRGRVVVNSPFRNLDFWRMTRAANLDEVFDWEPSRPEPGPLAQVGAPWAAGGQDGSLGGDGVSGSADA